MSPELQAGCRSEQFVSLRPECHVRGNESAGKVLRVAFSDLDHTAAGFLLTCLPLDVHQFVYFVFLAVNSSLCFVKKC